jgi:hypothetical protein
VDAVFTFNDGDVLFLLRVTEVVRHLLLRALVMRCNLNSFEEGSAFLENRRSLDWDVGITAKA